MGFRVIANTSHDWVKIAELAAADPFLNIWHPDSSELEVEAADQATLDTAFAAYVADQVNIDAQTAADKNAARQDVEKELYDQKKLFRAVVELLIDEINTLRQQFNTTTGQVNAIAGSVDATSFNDRTIAQARTAIRNKLDTL
jgi:hypothetical protein